MKIIRGRLYVADLNPRMGTETGKWRPVVVIQSDFLNEALHPSTLILPCTTHLTPENSLRVQLPKGCAGNDQDCDIMIDQARAIDNRRFKKALEPLPKPILNEMNEKLKRVAGL